MTDSTQDKEATDSSPTNSSLERRFEDHLKKYAIHRQEYLERQAHQDTVQAANLEAIQHLTKATQGLVDAWTVANNVQRFVVWVSKFAILGGMAIYLSNKFGIKIP